MGAGCRPEADKRIRNKLSNEWQSVKVNLISRGGRQLNATSQFHQRTASLRSLLIGWSDDGNRTRPFCLFSQKGKKICFNETAKVISVISCLPPAARTLIRNTGHFFAPTAGKTNFQYFSRWQRSPTRSAFTLRMIDRPLSPSYLSRFLFKSPQVKSIRMKRNNRLSAELILR